MIDESQLRLTHLLGDLGTESGASPPGQGVTRQYVGTAVGELHLSPDAVHRGGQEVPRAHLVSLSPVVARPFMRRLRGDKRRGRRETGFAYLHGDRISC